MASYSLRCGPSATSATCGPWNPCPVGTPDPYELRNCSVVTLRRAADTVDDEGLQRGHRWQEVATSSPG